MPFSATRDLWLVLKARDEGSRAMRSFSRDIRMVGDNVRMANLQASRSALINQMATQRLTGASQADLLVTQRRIQGIDQEVGAMRMARAEMEEGRVSAQKLGTALSGASGMLTAAGTAFTAIGVFGAMGLKSLVDSAVAYEQQAAATRTQVDKFATSLKDIEDIGIRVARSIGVPFEQIQPALFDIFSSMEVGAADAEVLLNTFAKAAVAGQTDIQSASRATIGILNAFQLPISQVNHLMDVQFQLVQEGIGTYEEWNARIGLVTPSAVRFGQSVEMMAAALAASTRMGISAARSGTSVARAMDAMSNPVAVENLRELGVQATDAEGNFRPMIDILFEFRDALGDMPEEDKISKILEVFKGAGGTIEARRFLQNMLITPGNLELFKTILSEMENESGSFASAYAIMADTTATKTQLMKNQWETLKITMGQALKPVFEKIIGWLAQLFEWYNNLTPAQQSFIAKAVAVAVVLSLIGGILLLVVGGLLAFAAAAVLAGSSLFIVLGILGGIAAGFVALAAAIYLAWVNSTDFRTLIRYIADELTAFWQDTVVPTGEAIRAAFEDKVLPVLEKLWALIDTRVLPIVRHLMQYFTTEGLAALGQVFNVIKDKVIWAFEMIAKIINENVIPAIAYLTKYYHEHEAAIHKIIDILIFLGKWFLIIAAIVLGVLIVVFVGPLVAAFLAVGAVIGVLINFVVQLIEWFYRIKAAVGNVINDIKSFVPEFIQAGQNMVDGLIRGVTNKIQQFRDTIYNLGANAVGWLKSTLGIASPSKEFMKLGQSSMEGFMLGMQKTMPALEAQVTSNTAGLTSSDRASSYGGRGNTGGANQIFNITTQEINPRQHAEELGWLLNGRS